MLLFCYLLTSLTYSLQLFYKIASRLIFTNPHTSTCYDPSTTGLKSLSIGVKTRVSWIAPFVVISLGLNNYCKSQLLTWKKAQHLKHTTIPVVKSSMAGSVRSTSYGHTDTNKGSGRGRGNVDASVGTNTPLKHQPENNQFQRYIP